MRINIVAVGVLKSGPEKQLIDYYVKQLPKDTNVSFIEINPRKTNSKEGEGELILQKLDDADYIITLDEKGCNLSTYDLHELISKQAPIHSKIVFVIGGADGLSDQVKEKSRKTLSLGRLTWPHMLVRVMLTEQLYRCCQITANHPYHRA